MYLEKLFQLVMFMGFVTKRYQKMIKGNLLINMERPKKK